MKFTSYAIAALLFCFTLTSASAQKLGHINSADLLKMLPEVKVADSTLQAYQKQIQDQFQAMQDEGQKKLDDYNKNGATLPDAVKQVKEQELQDLQNRISQFQQSAQDKFQAKKEELYSPILQKAEDAIKSVAKENNYAYVFDMSAGGVIYAWDSDDLMPLVKKKLNLK